MTNAYDKFLKKAEGTASDCEMLDLLDEWLGVLETADSIDALGKGHDEYKEELKKQGTMMLRRVLRAHAPPFGAVVEPLVQSPRLCVCATPSARAPPAAAP